MSSETENPQIEWNMPDNIVNQYFSIPKTKGYMTDEEYFSEIRFDNDTDYLYHLIEQNTLPDVLAPKEWQPGDSKYSQLSEIYLTYGALIGTLKAKAEGFLPISLFTGSPSIGKTTVALWFTHWLAKKFRKPFDADRCFLIGRNEFLLAEEVEVRFEPNDIIFIDEIQHMFNRYRAVSTQNIEFIRFLDSCRKYGIGAIIATTPRFGSSDPNFRSELVQLWFHVNKKDKIKKKSRCFLNINTETADGRELDYEKFGNLWLRWIQVEIYKKSVEEAEKEIYKGGSMGREGVIEKKEKLRKSLEAKARMIQISDIILDSSSSLDEKIEGLVSLNVSQKETWRMVKTQGYDIKFPYIQQVATDLSVKEMKQFKTKNKKTTSTSTQK